MLLKLKYFSGNPSLSNDNATDSICPYGWQLAEYSGSKSFSNLTNTYISRVGDNYPAHADVGLLILPFLRSGRLVNAALLAQNTQGDYWASRGFASSLANSLTFGTSRIYAQDGGSRSNGFSLRCLAR